MKVTVVMGSRYRGTPPPPPSSFSASVKSLLFFFLLVLTSFSSSSVTASPSSSYGTSEYEGEDFLDKGCAPCRFKWNGA